MFRVQVVFNWRCRPRPASGIVIWTDVLQSMYFMESGRDEMNIVYNDKTDLLYIRFDDRKQDVINRRVSEDIILDIGEND